MRSAFIAELIAQARSRPEVFLVVGDLGFSVVEPFAREFPDRFLNVGVAEQNMTGVAAGLASEGYHVFTYSIANFPVFRCLEQVRNDVCYHDLPVTVVAVGGGFAYGNLGYSHHAIQDYAVVRCLPGMVIAAPGDPLETKACVAWLCAHPGPSYLRLGKAGEPIYHAGTPAVEVGSWLPVQVQSEGTHVMLTTGAALGCAVTAAAVETVRGLWSVMSLPLWGESAKATIVEQLASCEAIIALEDHLGSGGFGSFLREAIGNDPSIQGRLRTVSLDTKVVKMLGSQKRLNEAAGLDPFKVAEFAHATA